MRLTPCRYKEFQSTHPHGVRRLPAALLYRLLPDFNPRTRTGCDHYGAKDKGRKGISIHAPARGATSTVFSELQGWYISIHAPARGATHLLQGVKDMQKISIHAPARGATRKRWLQSTPLIYFNPRTRTGCDWTDVAANTYDVIFQSTHPHGVRPDQADRAEQKSDFNPRTRTGCDATTYCVPSGLIYFNPRTRTGCDFVISLLTPKLTVYFNPRTRTGCDRYFQFEKGLVHYFNPRTRTGCD